MPFRAVDFDKWDTAPTESVHLQYCKYILRVNRSTSNILVRGELGRDPVKLVIDMRTVQTSKNFLNSKNDLVYQALKLDEEMYDSQVPNTFTCYLKFIESTVNHAKSEAVDTYGKVKIRKLMQSYHKEMWKRKMPVNPKANFAGGFKTTINFEKYFEKIEDQNLRIPLTKFRLSDHELNIETGRHRNIPRSDRHYPFCKPDIV